MRTVRVRAHIKAMSDTIEMGLVASLIALIADTGWIIKDISSHGLSLGYSAIGLGLLVGTAITAFLLVRHHRQRVRHGIKNMMLLKLAENKNNNMIQKAKRRHLKLVK